MFLFKPGKMGKAGSQFGIQEIMQLEPLTNVIQYYKRLEYTCFY